MRPTRPYLTDSRPRTPAQAPPDPSATQKPAKRRRRLLSQLAEGGLAILLTLACFLGLLITMSRLLPSATDLGSLVAPAGQNDPGAAGGGNIGSLGLAAEGWNNIALSVLDNQVMRKEATGIAWRAARSGEMLTEGDGIQTTREGMAVVAFDPQNKFRLGRNSLVVLRRPERQGLGDTMNTASLSLVSGDLWGDFRGGEAPVAIEIEAKGSVARLETKQGSDRSQFKVTTREDKSTTIAIFKGSAEITAEGSTVPVKAGQAVVVDANGVAQAPITLPRSPEAMQPAGGERKVYREFPPKLTYQWRPVPGADEYRLLIARDQSLTQVVVDERVKQPSYALGGLPAGRYWWSVTSIRGGLDGAPSPPRPLTFVEDRAAPDLFVNFGATRTRQERITLNGEAEPGARVFVSGTAAEVRGDGGFEAVAALKPGINLVVVEAVDAAGNTSYRSQEILRVADGGAREP